MSINIEAIIKPLDWPNIRRKFPIAASNLKWALDPEPATTMAAREARAKIEALAEALLSVQKTWDDLPDFAQGEITHWSRTPSERDADAGGGKAIIDRCIEDLLPGITQVQERMVIKGERDGRKTRSERERKIATELAMIYALATGRKPKCYNNEASGRIDGEYGKILERVMSAAGYHISDLRKLAKPVLDELSDDAVKIALEKESAYRLKARFQGLSLFVRH